MILSSDELKLYEQLKFKKQQIKLDMPNYSSVFTEGLVCEHYAVHRIITQVEPRVEAGGYFVTHLASGMAVIQHCFKQRQAKILAKLLAILYPNPYVDIYAVSDFVKAYLSTLTD